MEFATGLASSCSSSAPGIGARVGEMADGSIVVLFSRSDSSDAALTDAPWPSCELKSSCEKVTGECRSPSKADDDLEAPEPRRLSSSIRAILACWALRRAASSSLLRFSRPSTSSLLRSRDD